MIRNKENVSAEIKYLINLHKEGKIDDSALDKALNALQPTQTVKSDIQSPALEKLRKRRRDKKKKRGVRAESMQNCRKVS